MFKAIRVPFYPCDGTTVLASPSCQETEGLAETVRQVKALGAQVKSDRLDVAERAAVLAYADDVVAHFGQVHHVYNNAGIAYNGDVEKSDFKDIERVIDVDFWGVVNGTKAFLPHVIASAAHHQSAAWPRRLRA
jgi:NAD(P)-dependent dehydrogenase (short-subunit alcohol dehydrogenase family)